ncbi:MAG TPA: DNA-3-methyladenine glycosylase I [Candidatus Avacidaminococcus intestinavium]|uniref:DNA-3-methyladenine glycosylase I n=1 Tax=Candidatus Avacidaminococcus intestinavium TaxID=2840684 RepID=A0A9D1MQ27_9FIRM|nr:DNA-3-methyladenine glycosylase I [Candidatus Avacidaminococcus intestinavium]
MAGVKIVQRCSWAQSNTLMQAYHDDEWCKPSYDERYIFEMLSLEGAQAGLSWQLILNKRSAYQTAFQNFDIEYCANLTPAELEHICISFPIVKNRNKIRSVQTNALAVQLLQKQYGSFADFLWAYVDYKPIDTKRPTANLPASTPLSEQISKDLKKCGFKFVGPIIIYSFLQAIGLVNDHESQCFCRLQQETF